MLFLSAQKSGFDNYQEGRHFIKVVSHLEKVVCKEWIQPLIISLSLFRKASFMSSCCICSLWGLSLFGFWKYGVDCHFWSKTKKVIKAIKTTTQFLQSHLYFCLLLGWKNPQEHCSQKRIPRTVHGDHYSYLLSCMLDSLWSYSTTCNIW